MTDMARDAGSFISDVKAASASVSALWVFNNRPGEGSGRCRCHLRFSDTRGCFMGRAAAVSKLLSLLPYMAMARPGGKAPLFLSSGFGSEPAPLRHPVSGLHNDRALTELMFSRCNMSVTEHSSNPFSSLSRKWMKKLPPSLLTMDLVCAKLALQEMMLHVLCSLPLLGVPGIRYSLSITLYILNITCNLVQCSVAC